jgi:putative resolvase
VLIGCQCRFAGCRSGAIPVDAAVLSDPPATVLVMEHRDRLARLWMEHVHAERAAGRGDLVGDMIDVVTSICVRQYGRRDAQNRASGVLMASGFQPEPAEVVG